MMNVKQSPVGNSEMWLGLVKNFNPPPTSARRNISKIHGHRGERERDGKRKMGVGTKDQYLNTEAGMWFLK